MPWRQMLAIALLLSSATAVSTINALQQRGEELEQAAMSNGVYAQILFDCMSGAIGFYFKQDQKVFSCEVHPL